MSLDDLDPPRLVAIADLPGELVRSYADRTAAEGRRLHPRPRAHGPRVSVAAAVLVACFAWVVVPHGDDHSAVGVPTRSPGAGGAEGTGGGIFGGGGRSGGDARSAISDGHGRL